MRSLVAVAVAGLLALVAFPACSEDKPDPLGTPDGGTAGASLESPTLPCTDAADAVYADPGPLAPDASARGKVLVCARDKDLTKEALQAEMTRLGYAGKPLTSGARVYKIQYRTERGDAASTPSVSAAFVMIPDVPRAATLPVVVASRGSRGQAERCAVTKLDPSLGGINDDFYRQVYGLVGAGYAVVAPDLAGYAPFGKQGNPPSAYAHAPDVARSTIDGARAMQSLFPVLEQKLVLVGHSQGGHTALATLAGAEAYGMTWPVLGAALYAPLWLSQRSWGAVLNGLVGRNFPVATSTSIANVSAWYHYTHAELLDGPGKGLLLFAEDKRPLIEKLVKEECWGTDLFVRSNVEFTDQLFDRAFVQSVGSGAVGGPCEDAVCDTWVGRYLADRPNLTGKALETPLFVAYGGKDTTIPPDRMKCAYDRLVEDKAKLTFCADAEQDHGGIVSGKADVVADWIASVALGGAAPAACAANESILPAKCATPPPND